ncbi:HD domain-containing protein [Desulfofundulus thermocisternus]|nr:HD domain-containing protein [Desulfofundulus thermocisternus]
MMDMLEALMAPPLKIIRKYYHPETELYHLLVEHSKAVARKALKVADKVSHLHPDRKFLVEAAMLHDIGIFLTYLPQIGCRGEKPYVCHGYLGRELLENEGLPLHALVCERHVGAGITKEEIIEHCLPLPPRDMVPVTLEEKIICYADKFFSKNRDAIDREKTVAEIERELSHHGSGQVMRFFQWHRLFS